MAILGSDKAARGEPSLKLEFTRRNRAATRVLEIRFSQPLERFRTLQIDLLRGCPRQPTSNHPAVDAHVHDGRILTSLFNLRRLHQGARVHVLIRIGAEA